MQGRFKKILLSSVFRFYIIELFQLNMFVMGLVVRKFLTLKAVARKTEVAKLRYSVHATKLQFCCKVPHTKHIYAANGYIVLPIV